MFSPDVSEYARHLLRYVAAFISVTLLGATLATAASAAEVARVSGANRVATSVRVAAAGWDSADHVLLATARDYPDAVAAASLAASLDAPIILTEPDHLPDEVAQTLADLTTQDVTILGGEQAISGEVAAAIEALDITVHRISGVNRFSTAAAIAYAVAGNESPRTVALALGTHADSRQAWPDALSAATLAGAESPIPTLLTLADHLPEHTRNVLADLQPDRVLILGGSKAVSAEVANEIADLDIVVKRLRGDDRYATSIAVARNAIEGGDMQPITATVGVFVSGQDFADALSAGALAAHTSAPLLLVPEHLLDDAIDAYVRSNETAFERALLVGGTGAVSDHVLQEIVAAVNGEARPAAPPPPAPACPANSSPDCAYTYEHPISTWEQLAQCESGGNWAINTGNGFYGGVQFAARSWRGVGGSGLPHEHSKWEQIYRAELLHDAQGWGAWPACSRELGLR